MQFKKHNIIVLSVILLMTLFVVACANDASKPVDIEKSNNYNYAADLIVQEWKSSPHNNIISDTIGRDDCVICHDGGGFMLQTTKYDDIDHANPINCMTCHENHAATLKQQASIAIPTKDTAIGGQGNLCMTCHHGRGKPDVNSSRKSYPHYGPQADVMTGSGGMRLDNWGNLNNTYGHLNLDNSCVDCHMIDYTGHKSHNFKLSESDANIICGRCHSGTADFDVLVANDYDGNSKVEGIQTEVKGLMDMLYSEISNKLNGGTFKTERGAFVFYDSNNEVVEDVTGEIYLASYNYYLIKNDRSYGIHNPQFTIHLLQKSYKALTGKDVPNAFIIKGEL